MIGPELGAAPGGGVGGRGGSTLRWSLCQSLIPRISPAQLPQLEQLEGGEQLPGLLAAPVYLRQGGMSGTAEVATAVTTPGTTPS